MRPDIFSINVTNFFSLHISGSLAPSHFPGLPGKIFRKKFLKIFSLLPFPPVIHADTAPDHILGPPLDLLEHPPEVFAHDAQRAQYQAAKAQRHHHQRGIARDLHAPDQRPEDQESRIGKARQATTIPR